MRRKILSAVAGLASVLALTAGTAHARVNKPSLIVFTVQNLGDGSPACQGSLFGLSFDMPVWSSIDIAAFVLSAAAATAIFRLNIGMLWVLAGSCAAGVALRLTGVI